MSTAIAFLVCMLALANMCQWYDDAKRKGLVNNTHYPPEREAPR